jgi:hypothetical protein
MYTHMRGRAAIRGGGGGWGSRERGLTHYNFMRVRMTRCTQCRSAIELIPTGDPVWLAALA